MDFHKNLECQQSNLNFIVDLLAGMDSQMELDYIEELLYRDEIMEKPLRLLCLYSQIYNGLKPKLYDLFRHEIIQSYGNQMLPVLDALDTTGLFKMSAVSNPSPIQNNSSFISQINTFSPNAFLQTRSNYNSIRKQLHLIIDEANEENPQDIGYVYSGYAPLLPRIIEHVLKSKKENKGESVWKGIEESMKNLAGPNIEEVQRLPMGIESRGIFRIYLSLKVNYFVYRRNHLCRNKCIAILKGLWRVYYIDNSNDKWTHSSSICCSLIL